MRLVINSNIQVIIARSSQYRSLHLQRLYRIVQVIVVVLVIETYLIVPHLLGIVHRPCDGIGTIVVIQYRDVLRHIVIGVCIAFLLVEITSVEHYAGV